MRIRTGVGGGYVRSPGLSLPVRRSRATTPAAGRTYMSQTTTPLDSVATPRGYASGQANGYTNGNGPATGRPALRHVLDFEQPLARLEQQIHELEALQAA